MASISFPAALFDELLSHLKRPEEVAFMLAEPPTDGCFRVRELRTMGGERFLDHSDDHAELDDAIRGEVIRWAWESDACLVEAHSHGPIFLPARFSGFDFDQFVDWIPHVRWRLAGRPYAALVAAGDDIDGLAWIGEEPEAVDAVLVDGRPLLSTSGASFAHLEARRG
jgi:hypothetical protein